MSLVSPRFRDQLSMEIWYKNIGDKIEKGHAERQDQDRDPERPESCQVLIGFFQKLHVYYS